MLSTWQPTIRCTALHINPVRFLPAYRHTPLRSSHCRLPKELCLLTKTRQLLPLLLLLAAHTTVYKYALAVASPTSPSSRRRPATATATPWRNSKRLTSCGPSPRRTTPTTAWWLSPRRRSGGSSSCGLAGVVVVVCSGGDRRLSPEAAVSVVGFRVQHVRPDQRRRRRCEEEDDE